MEPLISVIVPVYNVEKYIRKCLDSIMNQTYQNLEIILVDDGSLDNSGTICDEYSMNDTRIKVIHKKNGGLSSARNSGLDVSTGDYITFVDSDDWIETNLFSELISGVEKTDGIIMYDICYVSNKGEKIKTTNCKIKDYVNIKEDYNTFLELVRQSVIGYSCNKLFRSELIGKHRFTEVRLREDICFMIDILSADVTIKCINIPGYNYRQQGESALHKTNIKNVKDFEMIEKMIHKGIKGLSEKQNLAIYNIIMQAYLSEILVRDIVLNSEVKEKCFYLNPIFRNNGVKKNLKLMRSNNRFCAVMIMCIKFNWSRVFLKVCNIIEYKVKCTYNSLDSGGEMVSDETINI